MKRMSILLLLLVNALNLSALERTVSIAVNDGSLAGTLLIPETANSQIAVLIIAGSGPTDRDGNSPTMKNNSLKMLANGLASRGISSLRYDKRGVGASKSAAIAEDKLRFDHYINDAESVITFLEQQKMFEQIVIIGHSEGALIGMVASRNELVSKFVSIAGAGQPIDMIIRQQLKAQPAVVLEQSVPILDKLLKGELVEEVPSFLNSLFRPSVQPYMISWFKYDPQLEIAKLKKPVLIVQGDNDIQVSVGNAERLAKANLKAEKKLINKMNHILKPAPLERQANIATYAQPELAIHTELIDVISEFIKN